MVDTLSITPSLPYYSSMIGSRLEGFIPFLRTLGWREMQTVSFRIWALEANSICYSDNHHAKLFIWWGWWVSCSPMVLETGVQYTKDSKNGTLLNTQHYRLWIKSQYSNLGKGEQPPLHLSVVAIEKSIFGSPLTTVGQFTLLISRDTDHFFLWFS